MENEILLVESIREKDIDIILLEELNTDIEFCKWFTEELKLPKITTLNGKISKKLAITPDQKKLSLKLQYLKMSKKLCGADLARIFEISGGTISNLLNSTRLFSPKYIISLTAKVDHYTNLQNNIGNKSKERG